MMFNLMFKRSSRLFSKIALILLALFFVSGCAHVFDKMDLHDETVLPPSDPIDQPRPAKVNGSIYQQGYEISLYNDHVPQHRGDLITVRLEEATQGEKQANMKTTKTTTDSTNNGTQTDGNGKIVPWVAGTGVKALNFNVGSDLQFDGKGATNEYNKLQGTITVTILRVLSNGNFVVQGESWLTINQGREYIRLSGIIRPEDILADNTISSQRVANARIEYSGSGQVGNSAHGGLITQLLYKFFPF